MVLEALTAVGLVGNIVQFIDFSCQLFTTTTKIRRSHAGASQSVRDIESITTELQQWCGKIASRRNVQGQLLPSHHNKSLVTLVASCENAAFELLSVLHALKVKNERSEWKCFRAALMTTWKESQITEMEKRLSSYRQQIHLELSLMQSDDLNGLWVLLEDLKEKNRQIRADLTTQISDLKSDIQHAVRSLKQDLEETRWQLLNEPALHVDAHSEKIMKNGHNPSALARSLDQCSTIGTDIMVSLILLDSLTFEQMGFRYSKVQQAHAGTCGWIFATHFKAWIKSPDPIFWVSGKPRSGKSTLMKHLVHNTGAYLSGVQDLIIADYFFWVGGTDLQRSQEGLLRAMLYDILRQKPQLLKAVLPTEWQDISDRIANGAAPVHLARKSHPWTRDALLQAFNRISAVDGWHTKLFIFIDGLDEYAGNHDELIQTIYNLTSLDVKLCVASRPWNVFEEAFGSNLEHKLYLQDSNRGDIQRYVDDHLRDLANFRRLDTKQADEIVHEVVEKSQGVFLWVYLVVRSLGEGLRNRDSPKLLQMRLREFPSDLSQFFRYIFLSLEGVYRSHLSHMFQIALTANQPLSPIAYWHLDEIDSNPDVALEMTNYAGRARDVFDAINDMTVRINGRCKGLLEVTAAKDNRRDKQAFADYLQGVEIDEADVVYFRVDFLHRTVRDFFTTTEMQQVFAEWQHPEFNPDLALCKIMLAELKHVAFMPWSLVEPKFIHPVIEEFLSSAQRLEKRFNMSPFVYLDEFERTFIRHLEMRYTHSALEPWTFLGCFTFFEFAVVSDLRMWVAEKLRKNPVSKEDRIRYLIIALQHDNLWEVSNNGSLGPDGLPEMISVLLSQEPTLESDASVQKVVLERISKLDSRALVSVIRGLYKHSIINKVNIGDPDEQVHQLIRDRMSWNEYLDLWKILRRENRPPQDSTECANNQNVSSDKVVIEEAADLNTAVRIESKPEPKRNSLRAKIKKLALTIL